MSRPIRIEFNGATYHVTSRGNERKQIFLDGFDRSDFLGYLGESIERYKWLCYAYCLMPNHYHLLLATPHGQLSNGMRHLNGSYAGQFNRRHGRVGHLFQGRFKAIMVDSDSYLKELARYVVLNPVRAKITQSPDEWAWSSYGATAGILEGETWLAADALLSWFGNVPEDARSEYRNFVARGGNLPSPWRELKNQVYLGSDGFIENLQARIRDSFPIKEVPGIQQRLPAKPLSHYEEKYKQTKLAMAAAYDSGNYSLEEIAEYFGVGRMTVSRAHKAAIVKGK